VGRGLRALYGFEAGVGTKIESYGVTDIGDHFRELQLLISGLT